MSDPRTPQREPDELELDTERVRDLEVEDEQADEVRGGPCHSSYDTRWCTNN